MISAKQFNGLPGLPGLSLGLVIGMFAFGTLGAAADVHAKVTAFFSAGATCDGGASANFIAGGPAVKVSLCVTATTEGLCGHTTKLQVGNAGESGRFNVAAVTYPTALADPNGELKFPIAITKPPANADFGATGLQATPVTKAKQLLVTFDIAPQTNATQAIYALSLAPGSSVGVSADSACPLPADMPTTASFKLMKQPEKDAKK